MRRLLLSALLVVAGLGAAGPLAAQGARVADLTTRAGEVPRRLVGYGIVVGLDGTGDRSLGGVGGETPTVRSVVNLLKRFNVVVPPEQIRARNVAAVVVTAETSPYLRAGGRFEVKVSSLGDATSLRGGVLWITPMVTDPDQPPVATAQGTVLVDGGADTRASLRAGASSRIPDGGLFEADLPVAQLGATPRLLLRRPDLGTASRIADAVNAAFGPGTAKLEDPGAVALNPGAQRADNVLGFLAAVDTLSVVAGTRARIVISARDGTVVTGGDVRVGSAVVSQRGITLRIGEGGAAAPAGPGGQGMVSVSPGASVQDVAAGLHAAGATSQEVGLIFESLREAGAITAEVVVR